MLFTPKPQFRGRKLFYFLASQTTNIKSSFRSPPSSFPLQLETLEHSGEQVTQANTERTTKKVAILSGNKLS